MNKLALIYDFMNVQYLPSHSPTHLPEGSRFGLVDAATRLVDAATPRLPVFSHKASKKGMHRLRSAPGGRIAH